MPRLTYLPDTGQIATHDTLSIFTIDATSGNTWNQIATNFQTDMYSIRSIVASRAGDAAFYVLYWGNNTGDLTVVRQVSGQGWVTTHTENIQGNGQVIECVTPSREWPGEAWVGLRGWPGQAKILHTTDFGATWEDLTHELIDVNTVQTIEVQPFNPRVLYVGTDLGMFRSEDGGLTWAPFQTGLPIGRCKELRFVIDPSHTGQHTLELAMDGRGLWSMPINAPPIVFVDKNATGMQDGTREHPYQSIFAGIQNAPSGAIVAVRSETYQEPFVFTGDVEVITWSGTTVIE
jgi:hypothetical protein